MKVYVSYDAKIDQIALDALKGRLMFSDVVADIRLELDDLTVVDKLLALISEDADKEKIYKDIEAANSRSIPVLAVKIHKKQNIALPASLNTKCIDWAWERMEPFMRVS